MLPFWSCTFEACRSHNYIWCVRATKQVPHTNASHKGYFDICVEESTINVGLSLFRLRRNRSSQPRYFFLGLTVLVKQLLIALRSAVLFVFEFHSQFRTSEEGQIFKYWGVGVKVVCNFCFSLFTEIYAWMCTSMYKHVLKVWIMFFCTLQWPCHWVFRLRHCDQITTPGLSAVKFTGPSFKKEKQKK